MSQTKAQLLDGSVVSVAFSAGTAGAPSLTFTSYPNTGLYSPGADQVAISTNGTGRLFVASDGKIGIGTSPSTELLTVNGRIQSQWNVFVNGGNTSYTGDATSLVTGASAGMWAARSDSALLFAIGSNEKARLDSSGRLGLGTSSPSSLLDVNGMATFAKGSTQGITIGDVSTNSNSVLRLQGTSLGKNWQIANNVNVAGIEFTPSTADGGTTYATPAFAFTSTGRLGIGTSSPSNILHVSGTAGTPAVFERTSTTGTFIALKDSASQTFIGNTNGVFSIQTPGSSYSDKLVVTSAGLVGIGTTSPNANLHIVGGGPGVDAIARIGSNQNGAFLQLGPEGSNTIRNFQIGSVVAGGFTLYDITASTERARIDSSGRVGIGTTSPRNTLDVNGGVILASGSNLTWGNVYGAGIPTIAGSSGTLQFYSNGSTSGESGRFTSDGKFLVGTSTSLLSYANLQVTGGSDGAGHVCLASTSAAPVNGGNIGSIRFTNSAGGIGAIVACEADGAWTAGSNYRSRLVFSTTADGASSPTERMRITQAGHTLFSRTGSGLTTAGAGFIANAGGAYAEIVQATTGVACLYLSQNFNSGTQTAVDLRYNNTQVGTINVSSVATFFNTSSDYRLKENIIPLTGAIDRIQQIPVHRFNFIADPDLTVDGFIAHEAQAVVPECVTGEKDAVNDEGNPVYQGIDQSKLVPLLTAALQEAVAEIKALKDRVTALESA